MSGSLTPNSEPNNGVYTAVFNYSHFFVISTATITNVLLSHHNSSIQCQSIGFSTPELETITIAGYWYNLIISIILCASCFDNIQSCSKLSIKPEYHCQQATSSTNMATSSS